MATAAAMAGEMVAEMVAEMAEGAKDGPATGLVVREVERADLVEVLPEDARVVVLAVPEEEVPEVVVRAVAGAMPEEAAAGDEAGVLQVAEETGHGPPPGPRLGDGPRHHRCRTL